MCRIFGFRSVIRSQVHHSLVGAENALHLQSQDHPDGWGVSYYVGGSPHVVKSENTALQDNLFKKVSGVVSSETVLAHIRKATKGSINILNTHPFQFGPWVFAHNGNIKNFSRHREKLLKNLDPELRRFVLGETDSELIFYSLLTHMKRQQKLASDFSTATLIGACRLALNDIKSIVGNLLNDENGPPDENYITFIITNGRSMLAHQGGKQLYYSTYKSSCSERNTCPSFSFECENASRSGQVNHMIFSSEPLVGENIWLPLEFEQMMGVDDRLILTVDSPT